ncbi:hypothetical protein EGY25_03310 [Brevundimonas intermedia]|uniref:DUF1508 domain-containing protein n=1 Tax=Brevundimonas intermedia TaxID=74315 RepID=A0A4Y9RYJ7_9CAUL|nr:hypothetical protein EGY25_03310 [Brevundimonas intermedia]
MDHAGYSWSLRPEGEGWVWVIRASENGLPLVTGSAPSRAVAAALVVRGIARGMTQIHAPESLAA